VRRAGGDRRPARQRRTRPRRPARVLVDAFGEPLTSVEAQLVAVYRAVAPEADLGVDAVLCHDLAAVLEGGDPEPDDPVSP